MYMMKKLKVLVCWWELGQVLDLKKKIKGLRQAEEFKKELWVELADLQVEYEGSCWTASIQEKSGSESV